MAPAHPSHESNELHVFCLSANIGDGIAKAYEVVHRAGEPEKSGQTKSPPQPGRASVWRKDSRELVALAARDRHETVDLALHDGGAGQDLVGDVADAVRRIQRPVGRQ